MLAEKYLPRDDAYYVSGQVFRAVSAMNQTLFALNEQWCLNEKKAVFRIDGFPLGPDRYASRVNDVFRQLGGTPAPALWELKKLCEECRALCEDAGQGCDHTAS